MTVYVGDIKQGVMDAAALIEQAKATHGALEQAPSHALVGLRDDITRLSQRIDVAIVDIDGQVELAMDALLDTARHPTETVALLRGLDADLAQMETLVDLRGYAGRVLLHLAIGGVTPP